MLLVRHTLNDIPHGLKVYEVTKGSERLIDGFYASSAASVLSACLNEHYGRHIGFVIIPMVNLDRIGKRNVYSFQDA